MKRLFVFIFALFMFGAARGDDINCPDGYYLSDDGVECVLCEPGYYCKSNVRSPCHREEYPNSDPGASDFSQCYSNWKPRTCTALSGCNTEPCQYRAYVKKERQGTKFIYSDGEVKDGCTEDDCSSLYAVALPGYYFDGDNCKICPMGTYSAGGENATCDPCPDGATTSGDGTASRDECMRILNYLTPGATTPTQISLKMKQNTSPAFAAQIGNDVFYGDMRPVYMTTAPGLYVGYNNQKYQVLDNNFVAQVLARSFLITTTADTSSFGFQIIASGNFIIDWGDGVVENIEQDSKQTHSHTYDTPGKYTIILSGRATGYSKTRYGTKFAYNAISFTDVENTFSYESKIARIDGSLGAVFPTLDDGTNPVFEDLFAGATNLTGEIPSNLFTGITGSPYANAFSNKMFKSVFEGCSGLTGQIPVGLFGDLSGALGPSTFVNAFKGCTGLTGPTAQNPDGTPLYDIKYNGQRWIDAYPGAFTDMYTDSGIEL